MLQPHARFHLCLILALPAHNYTESRENGLSSPAVFCTSVPNKDIKCAMGGENVLALVLLDPECGEGGKGLKLLNDKKDLQDRPVSDQHHDCARAHCGLLWLQCLSGQPSSCLVLDCILLACWLPSVQCPLFCADGYGSEAAANISIKATAKGRGNAVLHMMCCAAHTVTSSLLGQQCRCTRVQHTTGSQLFALL